MRVISGSARGIRLESPPGMAVRPTSDRGKEALFSILSRHIPGARVLDLFCGSGALAIEALSRGAEEALLVDLSPGSLAVASRNLEMSGLSGSATIVRSDSLKWVQRYAGLPFDLVFADPPYDADITGLMEAIGASPSLLDDRSVFVLERSSKDPAPQPPHGLKLESSRRYGAAVFHLFAKAPRERTVGTERAPSPSPDGIPESGT